MDEKEFLRKLAQCDDKEQMDRCINDFNESKKAITNADRIRAMSDEELAWELMMWRCEAVAKHHGVQSDYPNTQQTILKWLQQPAEQ